MENEQELFVSEAPILTDAEIWEHYHVLDDKSEAQAKKASEFAKKIAEVKLPEHKNAALDMLYDILTEISNARVNEKIDAVQFWDLIQIYEDKCVAVKAMLHEV